MVPLDEAYFTWLYSQVGEVDNKNLATSYFKLLGLLYQTEFEWTIEKDENRAQDGKNLRLQFAREAKVDIFAEQDWSLQPCSMFELFLSLAWTLAWEGGGTQKDRFWEIVNNIGLAGCVDAEPPDDRIVAIILSKINSRDYADNGAGGLFPLSNNDHEDQREVELWYQLQAYLLERI